MSTSITLLRSASLPELRDAQLTETAPLRIYLFDRFPAKDKTTSAEDNNSGLSNINAETRVNRVGTCPLLACEAGPDIHYAWRHDPGQIFGGVALDRLGGSFQPLFSRPRSTWISDVPRSLSRDNTSTANPLPESPLVEERVTGYSQGQDTDCPGTACDVGRASASYRASGWQLEADTVPILPFFTRCHERGAQKDTSKLSGVSTREEGQSQLGQPNEEIPSMWRGVLGGQDLADHGGPRSQEALPVQSSSLAYRCRQAADGMEISKKFESASKKSVDPPLRVLPDTDQPTCDEGPSRGVFDVERYHDLLLGQFEDIPVACWVRSRQWTNPEFEKKLDDIERAVVHAGLLIGNKYVLDEYAMDYARRKVSSLLVSSFGEKIANNFNYQALKKPVIFVVRPDPYDSMEELLETEAAGDIRWSFYFIGRDDKLYGYQYETEGYYVGAFNKLEPQAIAKIIIREQL